MKREVWVPYWSEHGSEHSTLHLRNALHQSILPVTIDVLSSDGGILGTRSIVLDRTSNLELPLAGFVQSDAAPAQRSGAIRILYSYPYQGMLQAELSLRDDKLHKGVTIVGRASYIWPERSAYLSVHVPHVTYLP